MTEEKNKKINFLKEAFKSIKDLDKYEDFALKLPRETFKYLLKLILIFTIIITCFYTYKVVNIVNEMYGNFKNIMPEFSYSEGILTADLEEPIIITEYEDILGKIIIDTKTDNVENSKYKDEIISNYQGMIFLKDKCIISSNSGKEGQAAYKYSEIAKNYNITEFTKKDAINYIEGMNIVYIYTSIFFVICIYLFIIYFIAIFIDVLILALLAIIVARISRIKFKFVPAFNIAIHSITLPVLLNLIYIIINILTGFNIKYFEIMYDTISYIYVIVGVLMIKTDFINRQMELIKLTEEQEKIREEMNKKKEEEEREKEENKNSEKKEEKTKNNKRKQENNEEEGTGANASAFNEKRE